MKIKIEEGAGFLADAGLNLLAILDIGQLPQAASQFMIDSGVPLATYRRLILLGHGGQRLWQALSERGMAANDPIDHYSRSIAEQFIKEYLGGPAVLWLYPGAPYIVPLQQLGELAGWSHPSPLGLGINAQFGVWFAYRCAFLTTAELPVSTATPGLSPCAACADQPCIRTCPVGAVRPGKFDVDGCARFRLGEDSPCADRCLSRLACPFFPEHRYTLPQIRYHYGQSLETLKAWYESA